MNDKETDAIENIEEIEVNEVENEGYKEKKELAFLYTRISSDKQKKGDGIARQIESARRYAAQNGLRLNESDIHIDDGLSAFHGIHASDGRLGIILAAIKAGKVPKGSTLLVESLDRLGRENVFAALPRFMDICNHDIKIAEISTNTVYSKEQTHLLHLAIAIMERAHNESLMKSQRTRASIDKRIEKAQTGKGIISSAAPIWLDVNADRSGFNVSNEHKETIQLIFKLGLRFGSVEIAKELNKQSRNLFKQKRYEGRSKHPNEWTTTKVLAVLRNEAVTGIGTFKRKSIDGESEEEVAIENYYPVIIPRSEFLIVKSAMKSRLTRKAKTKNLNNLFAGLIKCGMCGSTMSYNRCQNKGYAKVFEYLRCKNQMKFKECKCKNVNIIQLEELILTFYYVVAYREDLVQQDTSNQSLQLETLIQSLTEQIEGLTDDLIDLPKIARSKVKEKINNLDIELEDAKSRLNLELEKKALSYQDDVKVSDIKKVISRDNFDKELRSHVQANMQFKIEEIIVSNDAGHVRVELALKNGLRQAFEGSSKEINKLKWVN